MNIFSHESLVCVGIGGDTWCLPITASAGEAWGWKLLKAHSVTYLVVDGGFWGQSGVALLSETPSMWPLYVVWALYKDCGWFQGQGGGERREKGLLPTCDFCTLCKIPPLHTLHYQLAPQVFAYTSPFPGTVQVMWPEYWLRLGTLGAHRSRFYVKFNSLLFKRASSLNSLKVECFI